LSLTQSMVPNIRTRPEPTFSPKVNGDPDKNFTPVAVACCPTVGANCHGILQIVAMWDGLSRGLIGVQRRVRLEMGSDNTSTYPRLGPFSPEVKPLHPACYLLRAHSGYNAP
jgi:hypothetical protein